MAENKPYKACRSCPLFAAPLVPSYIPADATMILIGEAPGETEVELGMPFVGPSGQLLDHVLVALDIDPAKVAKTNAVLCRPKDNATPTPEAVKACSERLRDEIATIPSDTIVSLGGTATMAMDGLSGHVSKIGITARRGSSYPYGRRNYTAALHPAAVLRTPDMVRSLLTDVEKATSVAHKLFDDQAVHEVITGQSGLARMRAVLHATPDGTEVCYDTETEYLQWYSTPNKPAAKLLCLALAIRGIGVFVITPPCVEVLRHDLNAFFKRIYPIAHNAKFDENVLRNVGIRVQTQADTMLAHYALDEMKGGHGLKELAALYLNAPEYERELDKYFKGKKEDRNYGAIPFDVLARYAALDVACTLDLWVKLRRDLKRSQLHMWPFHNVLMPISGALAQVEHNGIMVDRPYLRQLHGVVKTKLDGLEQTLIALTRPLVEAYIAKGGIKLPKADWIKSRAQYSRALVRCKEINPDSWQQVQIVLFDVLNLQHTARLSYKTDPRSTAKEALLSLHPNDTSGFITALLEYRRVAKILGTYINKLLLMADLDDRVHINYLIHGTETGRLSATDALHGIPRPSDWYGAALRSAFIARPGYKLVIADFSQAELRIFAADSGEPTMLETFHADRDPHDETAKMFEAAVMTYFNWLYSDPNIPDGVKKEIRTLAKNVNFGEIYGGGAQGIWSMLGGKIPLEILRTILSIKRKVQHVAAAWKKAQYDQACDQGFIQTRFGRMRRFPLITDGNVDEVRKACVNARVQSEASDVTQLALAEIVGSGIMVCGTWHDSIIAEVPKNSAPAVARTMKRIMVETAAHYFPEVPWAVDVNLAGRWCKRPAF